MNKKLKILTVVGTRPEIIRLARIINQLDKNFNHILVNTKQNYDYELNNLFFDQLKIKKAKYLLNCSGANSIQTIANVLTRTYNIFLKEKPDAIVVLGDTNSAFSALSAKKLKIPIFHIEAGNRCFDQRVPEEINRKIVDHISDINLTYSEMAKNNLYREFIPPDTIFKIGSPLFEVISFYLKYILESKINSRLSLKDNNFFLLSFHREENIEDNLKFHKIIKIINSISREYKMPIIVSTHPRTKKKLLDKKIKFNKDVKFLKPLGYFDYMKLQMTAKVVLSDSGSIIEESNILDFPAICLRDTNERQEGIECGTLIMDLSEKTIINSIKILENSIYLRNLNNKTLKDYSINNVSRNIIFLIQSYIQYANRKSWHKF